MSSHIPSSFEDVRIDNWEMRVPSGICTNREIFDEIFSVKTWKTVLQPEQRERILDMLPAEVKMIPGGAEKTMEDLFLKELSNFGVNPLDELFDKLLNGHYDPEVVETKTNIVREWRRESFKLRKHYHTKLLQDIVVSRENHFRRLLPKSQDKGKGKKSYSGNGKPSSKRNGKPGTTPPFGVSHNNQMSSDGRNSKSRSSQSLKVVNSELPVINRASKSSENNKNKRARIAGKKGAGKDKLPEETATKNVKPSCKFSEICEAKSKEDDKMKVCSLEPSATPLSPNSFSEGISFRSPQSNNTVGFVEMDNKVPIQLSTSSSNFSLPPTSLLESLTSPIISSLPRLTFESSKPCVLTSKESPKMFTATSTVPASTSCSYLSNPIQSSPILASQLQAPSPISINLSNLTGVESVSTQNNSESGNNSSSITLNYTEAPLSLQTAHPSQEQQNPCQTKKSREESFRDEFDIIEPTIGFSGPPLTVPSGPDKFICSPIGIPPNSVDGKKEVIGSISRKELAHIQKCSLLTNCLTKPIASDSSSAAAVSAALANNILTSSPVVINQMGRLQPIPITPPRQQKIVLTTTGGISGSSTNLINSVPHFQQQQLEKFLTQSVPLSSSSSSSSSSATLKVVGMQDQRVSQQQLDAIFQQPTCSPIAVTITSSKPNVDFNSSSTCTFVSSNSNLKAPAKDLNPNSSVIETTDVSSSPILIHQLRQQTTGIGQQLTGSSVGPISLNIGTLQQGLQLGAQTLQGNSHSVVRNNEIIHKLITTSTPHESSQSLVAGGQSFTGSVQKSATLCSSVLSSRNNKSSKGDPSLTSASLPLLDSDNLNLANLGSFGALDGLSSVELTGVGVDLATNGMNNSIGMIKSEIMECGIDKMDDLAGVLDGNPFDSIPNLSDELIGLDLDMVDGLCDFEVLLSEEKQYASFFSLLRDVLCSTRDHRMTFVCLEKTIRKWQVSPGAGLNPWYMLVHNWNNALMMALNFLVGNYQDVHPEDFVPYMEYKYKTKYYQWIGAGRDSDNNLTPLCTLWIDNLERLPPLKKSEADGDEPEEEEDENDDSDNATGGDAADARKKSKRPQTPPPPRCTTDWTVRPTTGIEKEEFRQQEMARFDNPHKAFTYRMHRYESVVGPVKGVYSSQTGVTNKARGHSLLVDDRPPYVTILALVRDAVARLPNGEGTRSEICEMLRDSAFLSPEASNVTLNSVVSGALDRLHYERDPCVRYDSHKKSWIYLHRDRTQEQFERLHHNRSYTKSIKSRNSSNRKNRKASKSATGSSSSVSANSRQTISSSSSPGSLSTSDTLIQSMETTGGLDACDNANASGIAGIVGVASDTGGVVCTSGGTLSTLPTKISTSNTILEQNKTGGIFTGSVTQGMTGAMQQMQLLKQSVGIVNVNANTAATLFSTQKDQAVKPMGIVSLSSVNLNQSQSQVGPVALSNNEILSAGKLGFQITSASSPVVINQNIGLNQKGLQQTSFSQDATGQLTSRLMSNQQSSQTLLIDQTGGVPLSQIASGQVQGQSQSTAAAASIGPGKILFGPSTAILKLAGNIKLGESLRLAQLGGPTGEIGTQQSSPFSGGTSPLRLPQHRIYLARGSPTGQSPTHGVLLGQTATGQTVILSSGPSGNGPFAGLHALASQGGASTGQVNVSSVLTSSSKLEETGIQIQTSSSTNQIQQQSDFNQQRNCAMQTVTAKQGQGATKFGLINIKSNSNSVVVSSSPCLPSLVTQDEGTSLQQREFVQATTTPMTFPTSIFSSPQQSISKAGTFTTPLSTISTGSTGCQPQRLPLSHQQTFLGTKDQITSGNVQNLQTTSQQQSIASISQQLSVPQNVILTPQPQANTTSSSQQARLIDPNHQLAAPIIIRSSQGNFVSFGIPSNLSLGRGVQGIKVIPLQTGKQTVLARLIPPPPTGKLEMTSAGVMEDPSTITLANNSGAIFTDTKSSIAGINATTTSSSSNFASNSTSQYSNSRNLTLQQQPQPQSENNNRNQDISSESPIPGSLQFEVLPFN